VASRVEATNLMGFARGAKYLGNGVAAIDFGSRASDIRAGPGKLDRGISDSLASTTDRGSGLELEQEHGKKEAAEPLAGIQGASRIGGDEG
jgi:hypothetical protein